MKTSECKYCERSGGAVPDSDRECIHTCFGCGFWSEHVECSGIYYCPNPLCRSCGVTNTIVARCKREGVEVIETGSGYDIDGDGLRRTQIAMVRECDDESLLAFIREKYPAFMAELLGELPPMVVDHDRGDEQAVSR